MKALVIDYGMGNLGSARRALEEGGAPLKQVAADLGFENPQRLRRTFQRQHGVRPTDYRQRFATARQSKARRRSV